MSPISKDQYYFIAPCTFELLGGQMKLGDRLLEYARRGPAKCAVLRTRVISRYRRTYGKPWFRPHTKTKLCALNALGSLLVKSKLSYSEPVWVY